jgi:2-isopropylmalate synthase
MADRVYIFDTTLRDGEQSPGCSMTVAEKLKMAARLVDLGVDVMEAGFPIASEGDFEAVDAVSREFPWVQVAALARSTSDIHLKFKLKKSRQQVLEEACAAVALARQHVDDVEFSAEDATRTDWDYLEEVSRAVVAAGARTVNLPDTVGYSVPEEYGAMIGRMVRALGDTAVLSVHCHDDLGLAVANSIAAVQAGARQIECTMNGIGERAGNCSLEEVVMAFKTRNDRLPFETKIVTEQLYAASQTLSSIISFGPQPNKAIVGENAFAHEAGIHQDGYLKDKSTYEIIDPKSVGVPEGKLVLGKHSGRHALGKRAQDLGFEMSKDELDALYRQFTALADRKKGVRNDEITALIKGIKEGIGATV